VANKLGSRIEIRSDLISTEQKEKSDFENVRQGGNNERPLESSKGVAGRRAFVKKGLAPVGTATLGDGAAGSAVQFPGDRLPLST